MNPGLHRQPTDRHVRDAVALRYLRQRLALGDPRQGFGLLKCPTSLARFNLSTKLFCSSVICSLVYFCSVSSDGLSNLARRGRWGEAPQKLLALARAGVLRKFCAKLKDPYRSQQVARQRHRLSYNDRGCCSEERQLEDGGEQTIGLEPVDDHK